MIFRVLRSACIFGLLASFLFGIALSGSAASSEQDSLPNIESENIRTLVRLLEDPETRDVFITNLKHLVRLTETAGEQPGKVEIGAPPEDDEVLQWERWMNQLGDMVSRVWDSARAAASRLERITEFPAWIRSLTLNPEDRSRLITLLTVLAASLALAFIIKLLLRKFAPEIPQVQQNLPTRISKGFIRAFILILPYGVLLITLSLLVKIVHPPVLFQTPVLLVFLVLFFYRSVLIILKSFMSPEDSLSRIVPVKDETANYIWIWMVRFVNYTAFYYLVVELCMSARMDTSAFLFIRGVLLIVFPLLISVFLLQIAREIRMVFARYQHRMKSLQEKTNRLLPHMVRYWSLPALAYTWTLFVFLIAQYRDGFAYLFRATLNSAAVIILTFLVVGVLDWTFKRVFTLDRLIHERFPDLEERADRYIRIFRKGTGVFAVLVSMGIIGEIWGVPVADFISSDPGSTLLLRTTAILVTVALVLLVIGASRFVCHELLREKEGEEISKKRKTLVPLVKTVIQVSAIFVGSIVVLARLGVDTKPILAGAGIIGLAVGFGAQSLVKDVINGLFILVQDLISVGDVAVLGDKGGLVEAVGLRTVRLRDLAGNVHVIPNSSISTVTNMTKDYSRYVFDVGVAYREDVDEVIQVLREIGQEMQRDPEYGKDILEPLEILGVDKFADSAVIIRARITTKPIRQWAVGREFNRRMKKTFDARNIEIPFPHHTVYMGVPKTGDAAALNVRLDSSESTEKHPSRDS